MKANCFKNYSNQSYFTDVTQKEEIKDQITNDENHEETDNTNRKLLIGTYMTSMERLSDLPLNPGILF